MRRGLRMARELVASPRLKVFGGEEIAPGADKQSDAEIDAHIRATMGTVHHPVGTCKMGPDTDPGAVVDGELRVRGVDGLRVVDASVMPDLIGGATNAPVIMMAEKAADMILGKSRCRLRMSELKRYFGRNVMTATSPLEKKRTGMIETPIPVLMV